MHLTFHLFYSFLVYFYCNSEGHGVIWEGRNTH